MLFYNFLYAAWLRAVGTRPGRNLLKTILFLCVLFLWLPALHAQIPGYLYQRDISAPAASGEDLTNFPLLINLVNDPLLTSSAGHVQSNKGYDIIFTDQNLNILDHQIEYYDGTAGTYVAWVKIPSYLKSDSLRIRMFYGKPGVTTDPSNKSIWDSQYKGVYHFTGNLDDATNNAMNGTAMNGVPESASEIGKGRTFNGTNAYINLNHDLSTILGKTGSLTFRIKTSQKAANNANDAWECPGITGVEKAGQTNDIFWGYINKADKICFQAGDSINKTNSNVVSVNKVNDGLWHYVAITRDSYTGSVKLFLDNVKSSGYSEKSFKSTPFYDLGRIIDNGGSIDYFMGDLDEVRITNNVLTDGWINTEYASQKSGFCHIGPEKDERKYYSIHSGDWNNPANWSVSPNGPARTTYPGTNDLIYIQDGNTITLNQPVTVRNLSVGNGKLDITGYSIIVTDTLKLSGGTISEGTSGLLTLGNGLSKPGYLDYGSGQINGKFKRWINSTGSYLFPIGSTTYSRAVSLTPSLFTGGTVITEFVESNPGTGGFPFLSGDTISTSFYEGYWKLVNGDGFSSVSYNIALTGENFNSVPFDSNVRILTRTSGTGVWGLSGNHEAVNVFTVSRKQLTNLNSAETDFCLGGKCTVRANAGNVPILAVCGNKTTQLTGNNPISGTGAWSFVSGSNTPVITDQSLYNSGIAVDAYGEYILKWTITDKACMAADTVKVRFFENPSGVLAGDEQFHCGELTAAVQATSHTYSYDHPFSTKKWYYAEGPDQNPVITEPNSSNSGFTVTKYGKYTLRWMETNGTCKDSSDVVVNFGEKPIIAVTPEKDTICSGSQTSVAISSSVSNCTFTWKTGQGFQFGAGSGTGNSIQQILRNQTSSFDSVIYKVSASGPAPTYCKADTVNAIILVEPTPGLSITVDDTILNQTPITFQFNSPVTAGNMVYSVVTSYTDSISGFLNLQNQDIVTLRQTLNNQSLNVQKVNYTFSPKILYNSSASCIGTDTTITIVVNPTPAIHADLKKGSSKAADSICYNQGTILSVSALNKTITGTVQYELKVTYDKDSVQNVAGENAYNMGDLNQPDLVSVASSTLQNVSYQLTPFIELAGKKSFGTPVVKTVIIAPEIGYSLKSKVYTGGKNIRCFGETNGSSRIVNVKGGFMTTGYFYNWSNGNQVDSISNVKAGTYQVTVTDKLGCSAIKSITLSQPDSLKASLDTLKNITCYGGNTGKILITTLGGTSPYQYVWTGPGTRLTTEDITNIYSGNYSVEITDANSCKYIHSYPVSQAKDITWNSGESYYSGYNVSCNGGSNGSLNPQFKKGTDAVKITSFSWTGPNGFTSASRQLDKLKAGEYKLHVIDSAQCAADFKITLTEPGPVTYTKTLSVYSGNYNVQCNGGNNGKITIADVKGGIGPYTFNWYTASGSGLIANSPVQNSLTAATYKLTIKDKYCAVADSFSLSEPQKLNVNADIPVFNGYEVDCKDNRTGSINLNVSGGYGSYSYNWYTTDGNGIMQNIRDQKNLSAGNYQVTITYGGVCAQTYTYTLHEPQQLIINTLLKSDITCYGLSNGIIQNRSTGGIRPYQYSWKSSDGTVLAGDSIRMDLEPDGYTIEVTDANHCKASKIIVLTEPDSMYVLLKTNEITCSDGNSGAISADVMGGNSGYTYLWSNGQTTSSITGLNPGDYKLTVTDAKKCKAFASASLYKPLALTVVPEFITNYNGQNISCYGAKDGSIFLKVTGGMSPYRFQWSNGDTTQKISNLEANTYEVVVTDRNGCKGIPKPILLTQPDPISLTLNSRKDNVCYGLSEGLISVSGKGGIEPFNYVWSNGQRGSLLQNLKSGDYSVIVSDANHCLYRETISITSPDTIKAFTDITQPSCPDDANGKISLQIQGGLSPYQVIWDDTNDIQLSRDHLRPSLYSFRITDMNNCSIHDTIDLQPLNSYCVDAPTAFSPNGDHSNDYWEIYAGDPNNPVTLREMYPKAVVEIFTRWGTLVFRSDPGYPVPWDGTYQGRPLPIDSYYYVITPGNGSKPIKGIITIVK